MRCLRLLAVSIPLALSFAAVAAAVAPPPLATSPPPPLIPLSIDNPPAPAPPAPGPAPPAPTPPPAPPPTPPSPVSDGFPPPPLISLHSDDAPGDGIFDDDDGIFDDDDDDDIDLIWPWWGSWRCRWAWHGDGWCFDAWHWDDGDLDLEDVLLVLALTRHGDVHDDDHCTADERRLTNTLEDILDHHVPCEDAEEVANDLLRVLRDAGLDVDRLR